MKDGFHYICKPQWQGGMTVMAQRDIIVQCVLMRMFSFRASQGVSLSRESGYALLRRQIEKIS